MQTMLPVPENSHHNSEDLFIAVPFTWYIMSGYEEKNYKAHREKEKTHTIFRDRALEPAWQGSWN